MSASGVSHIKGKNAFMGVSDDGHASQADTYDNVIYPPRLQFPPSTNPTSSIDFPNIPSSYVYVQNPIDNDEIYVATIGDQQPYKDRDYTGDYRGTILYPGMIHRWRITNANKLVAVGTPQQSFQIWIYPNIIEQVEIDNTTPLEPDTTPPTLSSSTPVNGATGIATNTSIFGIFSEDIDPASVNNLSVLISPSVAGNVYQDTGNHAKIGFAPNTNLSTSTTYTITFKGTGANKLRDLLLNNMAADATFSFTTAAGAPPPDTTPPTVVSTNPVDTTTNVSLSIAPTITFSEAMLASTINTTNIQLINDLGAPVSSIVTLSADKLTATITPNSGLSNGKTYTIKITTGVTDLAANHLATQFTSTFTTSTVLTIFYNVAATASHSILYNNARLQVGIVGVTSSSPITNHVPRKVVVIMYRAGNPSGNVYCRIVDHTKDPGAPGQILATIGAPINISSIATSDTSYTFEDVTNNVALTTTRALVIEFTGPGPTVSDCLNLKRDSGGSYDGSNTCLTTNDGSGGWLNDTARDFAAIIYE